MGAEPTKRNGRKKAQRPQKTEVFICNLCLTIEARTPTCLSSRRARILRDCSAKNTKKRIGSIEAGKLADMVLIDGDPIKDIRVMRNISRVMLNGMWIDDTPADGRKK